jgi:hypothetical protein
MATALWIATALCYSPVLFRQVMAWSALADSESIVVGEPPRCCQPFGFIRPAHFTVRPFKASRYALD